MQLKNKTVNVILSVIAIPLAACSSGPSETDTSIEPGSAKSVSITKDHMPTQVSVTYARVGEPTFVMDGVELTGNKLPFLSAGLRSYYSSSTDQKFVGVSEQGEYATYAVIHSDDGFQTGEGGAYVERFGQTELPNSGTARLTGRYGGLIKDKSIGEIDNRVQGGIIGFATLEFNYEDATFSGSIQNRQTANIIGGKVTLIGSSAFTNWPNVADVTIKGGTFNADGVFTAQTTGGELEVSRPGTAENGSIEGLIAGSFGNQAVGIVDIQHTDGTVYRETGGFLVDR